jgi:ATP-dependent DNA helicase RecQ
VRLVDGRLGFKVTVKFLLGQEDERLARYRLAGRPGFGALRGLPEAWVGQVLQRCVTAGWVDFTEGEYPLLVLTNLGRAVLAGKREARLLLPPLHRAEPLRRSSRGKRGRREAERAAVRAAARGVGGGASRTPPPRGPGARTAVPPDDERPSGCAARFDALRRWRLERARADGVPAFVVATDRTLEDIATLNPSNVDGLADCFGIGPAKLERYGAEILEILTRAS